MPRSLNSSLMKPLVVLAFPGMYLVYKISEFKRHQQEQNRRKVTERELAHLNHKIDKLLTKLDEHEPELANTQDEECVICISAKATMQTFPCGHRVVCRKCFVKTIQMAVSQRMLPLRCVICRTKIIRLKQSSHGRATPVGPHLATARAALLSPCETLAGAPRPPFLTAKDFEAEAPALPDNHYRNSATACQFHRHCHRRSPSSVAATPTPTASPVRVPVDEEVELDSPRLKPRLEPALFHPLMESDDNEEDEEDVREKSAPRTVPGPAVQRLDPSQVQVHPEPTELRTTALIHPPPKVPRRSHRGTPLPSPTTPTTPDHPQDVLRTPTSPTASLPTSRSPSTSTKDASRALSPPPRELPLPLPSPTNQTPPPIPKPPKPHTRIHYSSKEAVATQDSGSPTGKPNFIGQPAFVLPPPPTSTEVRKKYHRVSPTGSTRGHVPSRFERFRDMHVRRPMPLFPIPEKEEVDLLEGAFCRVSPGASDYLIRTSSPKISVVQDRVPLLQVDSDQRSPSFRSQLKTKMAGFPSLLGSRSPLRAFRGAGKHKKVADVK